MKFTARPHLGDMIRIEIVYAEPARQFVEELEFAAAVTIAEAIAAAELRRQLPRDWRAMAVGVFGVARPMDWRLRDRDRVEIYRPLTLSPTAARRRRAGGARPYRGRRAPPTRNEGVAVRGGLGYTTPLQFPALQPRT